MSERQAIVVGAGPAGLTAAYELLEKTDVRPIVLEATGDLGGISKTINYKGNRIDIGGHRFFSKSDRVMDWWLKVIPLQGAPARDQATNGGQLPCPAGLKNPDPETVDLVMLIRQRLSRIYFLRRFFSYPVTLSYATLMNLGIKRTLKIGFSYALSRIKPIKVERSLEDFFINRFGTELYETFFKDYTEKVWGVPCDRIKPEWGAQRVKGLSIGKAIWHALKQIAPRDQSLAQKATETSLIEQFMYPKYGPGQMWEEVAALVQARGGEIRMNHQVVGLRHRHEHIFEVEAETSSGERITLPADYVFSSMPVRDLVAALDPAPPSSVANIAANFQYRDFITVGLLLKKMKISSRTATDPKASRVPDNWIYIQEREVKLGRIQVFNNWSPYLVKDPGTTWLGLEYFCNQGDELWSLPDDDFSRMAIRELVQIDMIEEDDVLDWVVIRMPKTYPGYFGAYEHFPVVRAYLDRMANLFLIGRNGMHRYNNMDHSMLTAMTAVENVINNVTAKDNIWAVNADEDYHEEK